MEDKQTGRLFIVGTPIGNLSDISPRGIQTLSEVDFIAAEDTRVSRKLLSHFNIQKPLISYHKYNRFSKEQEIISRILAGENCAIITDAGMPCISDPGEDLVRCCYENGITAVSVPGPSAVITALALSGLSTKRFSFEGFLSVTRKQRDKHLEQIKQLSSTLVFYEAPHKLKSTLEDLLAALGDRKAALCRELTKIHEEVIHGTLSYFVSYYSDKTPKGEYVLVIEGLPDDNPDEQEITLQQAAELAKQRVDNGEKLSDACKAIAAITPFSKSEIYKQLLNEDTEN